MSKHCQMNIEIDLNKESNGTLFKLFEMTFLSLNTHSYDLLTLFFVKWHIGYFHISTNI